MPIKLLPAFLIGLLFLLLSPLLFPSQHLCFFAPFIIVACYKKPLHTALWCAALAGIAIDLFSSVRFGIATLNCLLTAACIYGRQRHFFEDKFSTLPLMTLLFSLVSYLLYILLLPLFAIRMPWITRDLYATLLQNGIYTLTLFALPFHLYRFLIRLIERKKRGI